jgi:hypothetical protein
MSLSSGKPIDAKLTSWPAAQSGARDAEGQI